ncbi:MAG: class I SAM-dependent methyltransferase [Clostridiales bacterium]|nr:class I SAM-dependent methyltransferase [Clostridiales bacterium]
MKPAYRWALTTSAKAGAAQIGAAASLAERYRVPYIPRGGLGLGKLREIHQMDYLVTVDRDMRVYMEEPPLHWHPSMAIPRFRRLMEGGEDIFLSAAALREGDEVLDCTLGLGTDALIAAWAVGDKGKVLGLEASPVIALVAEWGLGHEAGKYDRRKAPASAAAGRIAVLAEEAGAYLRAQRTGQWDVVYFDPMFQKPNPRSDGMNHIRPLACYEPFTADILGEALRVCRKRVVLKERWFSALFRDLGAGRVVKTKYGPVAYGVWDKEG